MFTLVIGERRPLIWPLLQEVFVREEGVELWHEAPHSFVRRTDLDALIKTAWYAHEHYGDIPTIGVSQILNTGKQDGVPQWVVTTPGFPIRLEFDDSEQATVVPIDPLTPREEAFVVFSKVFEAVETHNRSSVVSQIQRLGCDLEVIRTPLPTDSEEEMVGELESIRAAFRAFRERGQH